MPELILLCWEIGRPKRGQIPKKGEPMSLRRWPAKAAQDTTCDIKREATIGKVAQQIAREEAFEEQRAGCRIVVEQLDGAIPIVEPERFGFSAILFIYKWQL